MFLHKDSFICSATTDSIKTYTIDFGAVTVESEDVILPVYHKQQISDMHRKDIGQKMMVYCLHERDSFADVSFDAGMFSAAFGLFRGFDENTGDAYNFLYQKSSKDIEALALALEKFSIDTISFEVVRGVVKVRGCPSVRTLASVSFCFSFLFGLSLVYGTWQTRADVLQGIKIQVPLFGTYLSLQEEFDAMLACLVQHGVYIEKNILQTKNGVIYQMHLSDWEVLSCFAKWYKPLASLEKISTRELVAYHRDILTSYLRANGADDFVSRVEHCILKILKRT